MRPPRLKPDTHDTWHHCYNRSAGFKNDHPLSNEAKTAFIGILRRLSGLYVVEVVSYCLMNNHFHILLRAPKNPPGEEETMRRYEAFHKGRYKLEPGSEELKRWQARLRDVSGFMQHLQQVFSIWYNNNQERPRRGAFWSGRYKNTVLEEGESVVRCLRYIETNPVRAGITLTPQAYRFSSYGHWQWNGKHHFRDAVERLVLPMMGMSQLIELVDWLSPKRVTQKEPRENTKRRVDIWIGGLAIGTEKFVRQVVSGIMGHACAATRRLDGLAGPEESLFAWRRMRTATG